MASTRRSSERKFARLLSEFQSPQKFSSVKKVAGETVLNRAYLSYAVLSMDGHPSITSLKRYLQWEIEGDTRLLTVNVTPKFKENERVKTVEEACNALLGACVAFNQLVGGTSKNAELTQLIERFESGQVTR